ncbi:MAG: isoprenylcysteine carboxylmethyltransferase family protein, partial [Pseudomonadota bacterium]
FEVLDEPRVVFLLAAYFLFFLGAVWRVVWHGKLAHRANDRQVQSRSGRMASALSIIGLIAFHWLSIYGYAAGHRLADEETALAPFLLILAISMILIAMLISQVAIRTLGTFFDRLTIKTDHRLVTEGIYGWIRHPIYTGYILLFLGFCLTLESTVGLILSVVTCALWFGNRIPTEERMLEEQFGEDYRSYCNRSRRLFPFIY